MPKKTASTSKTNTKNDQTTSLYNWNVGLAIVHALQGVLIVLLSATKLYPVQTSYLTNDPLASELAGHDVSAIAIRHVFDMNLAYVIAAAFFVMAIGHALAATIYREQYESDLKKHVNKLRWMQYAFGFGAVMVALGVLVGITDLSALIMIFVLKFVADMIFLAMELYNQNKTRPSMLLSGTALVASAAPWFTFAVYLWAANVYGSGSVPGVVYGVVATTFVLFMGFGANLFMQYKKTGNWASYPYVERAYMILTAVTITAVAWQLYAGALRP